jgi:hypothetical protein
MAVCSDWLRQAIYDRDGRRCVYCGAEEQPGLPLTLDHVIPVASGGLTRPDNLVTCCEPCNQAKGQLLLRQYLQVLRAGGVDDAAIRQRAQAAINAPISPAPPAPPLTASVAEIVLRWG